MGHLSHLRSKRPVGGSSELPSAVRTLVHTGWFSALSQDSQAHRPSCLTHTLAAVSRFHMYQGWKQNKPLIKKSTMNQVRAACWRWCLLAAGIRRRLRAKEPDELPSTRRAVSVSSSLLRRKFPFFSTAHHFQSPLKLLKYTFNSKNAQRVK